MNTYFKRIGMLLALLFVGLLPQHTFGAAVQINTLSGNWLTGSAGSRAGTNLFPYGVEISQIVIQNQNASATVVGFFDSQDKFMEATASIAVYTATDISAAGGANYITNSITQYLGNIPLGQTNITKYGISTSKANTSVTTQRAQLLNVPVAGSTTTTLNFNPPLVFGRGVTLTNNNATQVITFTYEPLLPQ